MGKSSEILQKIRGLKFVKTKQFLPGTINTYGPSDAINFEPRNSRENLAWSIGYLRGLEAAENIAAEILYPTIDTDE